jgi:hypothetical protein
MQPVIIGLPRSKFFVAALRGNILTSLGTTTFRRLVSIAEGLRESARASVNAPRNARRAEWHGWSATVIPTCPLVERPRSLPVLSPMASLRKEAARTALVNKSAYGPYRAWPSLKPVALARFSQPGSSLTSLRTKLGIYHRKGEEKASYIPSVILYKSHLGRTGWQTENRKAKHEPSGYHTSKIRMADVWTNKLASLPPFSVATIRSSIHTNPTRAYGFDDIVGEIYLDAIELGQWLTDYMSREIAQSRYGIMAIDPRVTPSWGGPSLGT